MSVAFKHDNFASYKRTVGNVGEGSGGATDERVVAPAAPSCCGEVRGGSATRIVFKDNCIRRYNHC